MNKRKIALSVLGILLIVVAILLAKMMINNKQRPKPIVHEIVKTAFVATVKTQTIPIVITTSGTLIATNKIAIFSEVQGILETSKKAFKAGTRFQKGETLLRINSDEFYASLQSQKSNLFNLIMTIIPDIRLDYPAEYSKWNSYIKQFDFNKPISELPKFSSDKEKYFVSGKGIITSFFTVKNLEVKLKKHQLKAPFDGILTEASVSAGSLVRIGQKLGEYIDPSAYEMEVSVNATYANLLKIGAMVSVFNTERTQTFKGTILRINGNVDSDSQTVKVYVHIANNNLKEGMYLEVDLVATSASNALEIPRNLLIDNASMYTVKNDSILSLIPVTPVFYNKETVVVKGIKNNTKMLTQNLPGAYDGMVVKMHKKEQ